MQTRAGIRYGANSGSRGAGAGAGADPSCSSHGGGRKRDVVGDGWSSSRRKRRRVLTLRYRAATADADAAAAWSDGCSYGVDFFDGLPDDLVLAILCKLSLSASCPADFISVLITCKRLNGLLMNPVVLARVSQKALAIRACRWSEPAHRFLRLCSEAGNLEACYILGMIRFYCLQNRPSGASLMAKAAVGSHAAALYSLAVIQFNGSGGTKNDKDLRAGVALCARAAFLGHVDALRELGHCLQDGYGVRQNVTEGRRFLVQANARELASVLVTSPPPPQPTSCWRPHHRHSTGAGCPLLSDFGCNVPVPKAHPANQFLVDWFTAGLSSCLLPKGFSPDQTLVDVAAGVAAEGGGLRLCSHAACGRPETRRHEFRRCSVCGAVNYCSRACQALDWKIRHKAECIPMERWLQQAAAVADGVDVGAQGVYVAAVVEGGHELGGHDDGGHAHVDP